MKHTDGLIAFEFCLYMASEMFSFLILCLTEYIGPAGIEDEEDMRSSSPNLRRNDGSYPILNVTEDSYSDDPDSDIQDIPIMNQGNNFVYLV